MFQTISNFIRVRDIRNKIIFTLLMLIVFRIGSFIPVPNVDAEVLKLNDEFNLIGFLNTFGGGALSNFSIFALGIMPYITASIIVQLLQMDIVPKFSEWAKEGEVGRKKLAQFTRYFTVILAFIQALAMSYGFNKMYTGLITDTSILSYITIALVLTAGTAFLLWLGEQITAYGVGNGISIIIFAGIVAAIPTAVNQIYAQQIEDAGDQLFIKIAVLVLLALVLLAVVVGVIYINQALRKIPIQYAKRVAGRSSQFGGGQQAHLPLKVNSAGVIPVIFAVAFLVAPRTVAIFFGTNSVTTFIQNTFDYTKPIGMILYVILIIAFTYFYAFVQVNPENVADNLKKQGAYIPGIRPGNDTQNYLTKVLYRLTFVGAIFLVVISIMPILFMNFMNLPATAQIGGTSVIIVVGVALETMKQLEAQLVKRHYKGFMK